MAPTIVTRAQWGARPPTSTVDTVDWSRRTGFVVHYSSQVPTQTVRSIQDFHMDTNGWRDIGYNWLVTTDGRIWEGRQHTWTAVGAHVENHNTENIGACMIGRDQDVTAAAKASLRWLYDEACRLAGRSLAQRYHSFYASTECPGDQLRAWVVAGMPDTEEDSVSSPIEEYTGGHLPQGIAKMEDPIVVPAKPSIGYNNAVSVDNKLAQAVRATQDGVAELVARPPVASAPVDQAALDAAVRAAMTDPAVLSAIATAVADEHQARLAE